MALIKCSECGKEISDKAPNCVHCGCPIEKDDVCIECGKEIKKGSNICSYCGCPTQISNDTSNTNTKSTNSDLYYEKELFIDKLELNYEKIEKFQRLFIILGIICCLTLFGIVGGIILFIYAAIYGECKRNDIILTNKGIKGKIRSCGSTETVDIPLDKIDSITCGRNFLKIERLIISSNSKIRGVMFSANTEDFCDKTLKEIEKYKKYVYRRDV